MARRRHTPEQIINKLYPGPVEKVEVLIVQCADLTGE